MSRVIKIAGFWIPVLVYSGIIFWLSAQPDLQLPRGISNSDKVAHVVEYIPYGFLLARAFYKTKIGCSGWVLIVLVTVLSFFYGLSDEYHQSFILGRDSSIFDAVADLIGGLVGGIIFIRWNKGRK